MRHTKPLAGAALVAATLTALFAADAAAQARSACPASPALTTFLLLGALGLVPLVFMAVTSFIKITIVFSILRNALGIGQVPSGAIIAVLAAVLTFYVMAPVGRQMLAAGSAAAAGVDLNDPTSRRSLDAAFQAFNAGKQPLSKFLKRNAGKRELDLFVRLGQRVRAPDKGAGPGPDDLTVALPAFLLTELKEAFQIGFLVYIPFLVIDLVVASVLLALGMQMLSPAAVSLPFKLLMFVMVDGWYLLTQALVLGYSG